MLKDVLQVAIGLYFWVVVAMVGISFIVLVVGMCVKAQSDVLAYYQELELSKEGPRFERVSHLFVAFGLLILILVFSPPFFLAVKGALLQQFMNASLIFGLNR